MSSQPPPFPREFQPIMVALQTDRLRDAEAGLRQAMAQAKPDPRAGRMLLTVLTEMNLHAEAAELGQDMLQQSPRDPVLRLVVGDLHRALGERDAARACYREALEVDPGNGRALWSLLFYKLEHASEGHEAEARTVLAAARAPHTQAFAQFALGEVAHAGEDHAAAFRAFTAGNDLLARIEPYNSRDMQHELRTMLAELGALTPSAPLTGKPGPIFMLGMPRSGSTLLETMLAAHAEIEPIGESRSMARLVGMHFSRGQPDDEGLRQLGRDYIDRSAARRRQALPFFIDKMHLNWRFTPVILRSLPQARIIDLRRGALDCCWSNYRFPFQGGHPASCRQQDIASFYKNCTRVLDAAQEADPERVLSLDYEDLIAQPEACLEAICGWLGVDYDEDMLHRRSVDHALATASSEQVRQPINRQGIGAHIPYREWLDPMAQALKG